MQIRISKKGDIKTPTKAHKTDAGFDIYSPVDFTIAGKSSVFIDTKLCMQIPEGYVGFLKSKSGLNCKYSLVNEGVIDAGYTGTIGVKLYNNGNQAYHFAKGDKLTQIVILPIPDVWLVEVDDLAETDRGTDGFGSSGR